MKERHVTMHDLRYDLEIPPLATAINYRKASYFGHTMRREDTWVPKLALTGRFLPDLTDSSLDSSEYFFHPSSMITHSRRTLRIKKRLNSDDYGLVNGPNFD